MSAQFNLPPAGYIHVSASDGWQALSAPTASWMGNHQESFGIHSSGETAARRCRTKSCTDCLTRSAAQIQQWRTRMPAVVQRWASRYCSTYTLFQHMKTTVS